MKGTVLPIVIRAAFNSVFAEVQTPPHCQSYAVPQDCLLGQKNTPRRKDLKEKKIALVHRVRPVTLARNSRAQISRRSADRMTSVRYHQADLRSGGMVGLAGRQQETERLPVCVAGRMLSTIWRGDTLRCGCRPRGHVVGMRVCATDTRARARAHASHGKSRCGVRVHALEGAQMS